MYHVESQGFIYVRILCVTWKGYFIEYLVGERIYKSLPVRVSVRVKQFDL